MFLFARCLHLHSSLRRAIDMFSILLSQRTHWRTKSMTQRSNYRPCTNCADFKLLASTGEELVWKYNGSFDFTFEWFADFELFSSTGEQLCKSNCESTKSPLISQLIDSLQRMMDILNRVASLLSFPTFFRKQQAVVGNILKILEDPFWSGTSALLDALERKQRPGRRTWSISWHLHSRIGKSNWSHSKAAKHKLSSFLPRNS